MIGSPELSGQVGFAWAAWSLSLSHVHHIRHQTTTINKEEMKNMSNTIQVKIKDNEKQNQTKEDWLALFAIAADQLIALDSWSLGKLEEFLLDKYKHLYLCQYILVISSPVLLLLSIGTGCCSCFHCGCCSYIENEQSLLAETMQCKKYRIQHSHDQG